MNAIILAAGEGTRLRPYTLDRPKCLVELGGRSLLRHQIDALRAAGVKDITVMTGYRSDQIESLGLWTCHNPDYDSTNMVATLMCADDHFTGADDILIVYGDIVFEPRVVKALIDAPPDFATTVDLDWERLWRLRQEDPLDDAETMRIDPQGNIVELGRKPDSLAEIEAQYMGLIKVGRDMATTWRDFWRELDPEGSYEGRDKRNMFMTTFLQALIDEGHPLAAVGVHGGWLEVDTTDDLDTFRAMLKDGRLAEYWQPTVAGPSAGRRKGRPVGS